MSYCSRGIAPRREHSTEPAQPIPAPRTSCLRLGEQEPITQEAAQRGGTLHPEGCARCWGSAPPRWPRTRSLLFLLPRALPAVPGRASTAWPERGCLTGVQGAAAQGGPSGGPLTRAMAASSLQNSSSTTTPLKSIVWSILWGDEQWGGMWGKTPPKHPQGAFPPVVPPALTALPAPAPGAAAAPAAA